MIFQPTIIALLLASGLGLAMLLAAAPFAVAVIRHWDIRSGAERQLQLERRTYLFSTLLSFVLAVQVIALLLFVFNADRMAALFVGAMCAVGTLNVNAYGFPALILQMAIFFLATVWLVINHVDTRASDYPLVRIKYGLLLALVPVVAASFFVQLQYFLGLKANVITSCCGSLFSEGSQAVSGDLAALPAGPAMIGFYVVLGMAVAAAGYHALTRRGGYLVALASGSALVAALAGILSFLSLYIYEHPHHHCPFCILKPEYNYQGYWLYIPLFAATAAGLAVGALQFFRRVPSLAVVVPATTARLAALAAAGFLMFTAVATLMVLRSNLILFG
ncbi:MAG: hypothetical protein KKF85_08885 [Gammaproteobacteria bacterium]|nr:hypothetical protein [Rhodocyclaceae bacterium]MBU3908204.1 hypothetical protein [Gammaproteobacteria bacterium]MBU3988368.1 hypothetical protein [Gammaproteobacteria bacterium]MBU4005971.1 hypothetical protein [Gammaproteobacteria bacterium]MBU4020023.1 hypothetical protein [Gammaproteobacteria bacterium]